jgi:hypothetical protein
MVYRPITILSFSPLPRIDHPGLFSFALRPNVLDNSGMNKNGLTIFAVIVLILTIASVVMQSRDYSAQSPKQREMIGNTARAAMYHATERAATQH